MRSHRTGPLGKTAARTAGILILLASCLAASSTEYTRQVLSSSPVIREKTTTQLSTATISALEARDGDAVKVWVFFTDKGMRSQTAFEQKAVSVALTERALHRRAKVDRDRVLFVDIPVEQSYVDRITALGAKHRRSSRWLNAATFEVPADQLETIAGLPFVARVKPMQIFRQDLPAPEMIKHEAPSGALAPDALNYGDAADQLAQINVPAVHDLGYTGAGVTLAIMDTGFRKTHNAFAQHYLNGRVLAEWDFVNDDGNTANEAEDNDWSSQWNHGTYIFSVSAGEDPGNMYGPAYHANIILCKTEDVRSETQVEEDNWVAALEFSDSIGTDVITTSLGYDSFDDGTGYTFEDMDGQTAVISIAASTCDGLGIVMCNSMGNSGPGAGTLSAPADALDIISVGNVNSSGTISVSSSRGPTADGRIKPDVCARGSSTACAASWEDDAYTFASGTSLSTPLVAGAACLIIEAHPEWTPADVREAMRMTASQASTPDNTYGWGIIDVLAAINYENDCCIGTIGNVDGSPDQTVSLGDLTAMVDVLFISLNPVACPAEADVDQSGGTHPTQSNISLGDLTALIGHLFITLDPFPACP